MEESNQPLQNNSQPSYWTSVIISGVIFGIVAFVLSLISSYAMINAEPSGSFFSPVQLIGVLVCLISAFGGMLAAWHYINEYDIAIKLGKGALIGFLTGVCITVVTVILGQLWQVIDPDMMQKLIDSTIENMEAMDMAEGQKQQIIDSTVDKMRSQQNIGTQLLWGIPMYGILNLITGIIGAKIFSKDEENFSS